MTAERKLIYDGTDWVQVRGWDGGPIHEDLPLCSVIIDGVEFQYCDACGCLVFHVVQHHRWHEAMAGLDR